MSINLQTRYRRWLWFASLALVACASIWWLTWPERTWRRLVESLEAGKIDQATMLCDGSTVTISFLEGGRVAFSVRSGLAEQWLPWPGIHLDVNKFRDSYSPSPVSWTEWFRATSRLGNPSSVWFGHFEIVRGRLVFRSDTESRELAAK